MGGGASKSQSKKRSKSSKNTELPPQAQIYAVDGDDSCAFFFVPATVLKQAKKLPMCQHVASQLVKRVITFQDVVRSVHRKNILIVSHRWESFNNPDPEGKQHRAIMEELKARPEIEFVWIDWCCMPQGERTEEEKAEFKRMLPRINMLYLGASVLLLVDTSYQSRFWTQFEAWLSMQQCTITGLVSAVGAQRRWVLRCIHLAQDRFEGSKLESLWANATASRAYEVLSSPDVTVTNQADKDIQLAKVLALDGGVRVAYAQMMASKGAATLRNPRLSTAGGTLGPSKLVTSKLDDPNKALSPIDSLACLLDCIDLGYEQAAQASRKDLVLVIGNTGAGKSSFVNKCHGCTFESVRRADAGLEGRGKMIRVAPGSPVAELMEIGHTNMSKTFTPVVKPAVSLGPGFAWADCPGFLDNRGFEINIANAANIKQTIAMANSVRVVVLVNHASLEADRGRGVRELIQILVDLFGSAEQLTKMRQSALVGISKAPLKDRDEEELTKHDVAERLYDKSGLRPEAAAVVDALKEQIFVFDVLDKGHDTWTKCDELLTMMTSLPPIADPGSIFRTVLSPDDERELRQVVEVLVQEIEDRMGEGNFRPAADILEKLMRIERIDNVVVTRMIGSAMQGVERLGRRIEKQAMTAALHEEFGAARSACEMLATISAAYEKIDVLSLDFSEMARTTQLFMARRLKERDEVAAMRRDITSAQRDRAKLEGQIDTLNKFSQESELQMERLKREKLELQKKQSKEVEQMRLDFESEQRKLAEKMKTAQDDEKAELESHHNQLRESLAKKVAELEERARQEAQSQQQAIDAAAALAQRQRKQADEAKASLEAARKAEQEKKKQAEEMAKKNAGKPALRRVNCGKGWAIHGIVFEWDDGQRTGTILTNSGRQMELSNQSIRERCNANDWREVPQGDRVVKVSGRNCNNGYLCHSLSLHFQSGNAMNFEASNPSWSAGPFRYELKEGEFFRDLHFSNGKCTGILKKGSTN